MVIFNARGSSFQVLIDDGGLDEAMREVPFSVGFASLRMFRRILFQHEKETAAKHPRAGMRKFIRKAYFVQSNPQVKGPILKTMRNYLRGQGTLDGISADAATFGDVAKAHEQGETVRGRQVVLSDKFRRGLKGKIGKFGLLKNATGNLLRALGSRTPIKRNKKKGTVSPSTVGQLISFKGKNGLRNYFLVKRAARGSVPASLDRVASEVNKVVIPATTGFVKTWDSRIASYFNQHQTDALDEIVSGFARKARSKKVRT